jgi:hypothetical protein
LLSAIFTALIYQIKITMKQTAGFIIFLTVITLLAFNGCRKDEMNTDPAFKLGFSNDTVLFDTVFTTIGSVTRSLVIRNTGNSRITISKISLARGKASPFRLNIDGTAAEEYSDLEIGPNDSAYIFVKVTIDPNNVNTPFIETDSVVFQTNGNIQSVKLVAWGQDAYFHINEVLTGDLTLADDKPHVIYGTLTADHNCNLSILAGTKLYFHTGSSIEIHSGASLNVAGTLDKPVTFTGDRLDGDYPTLPGMWEGIWLENGCKNISFTYAEITNAKVGIQADSCGLDGGEPLRLHNCMIHNMTNYGIIATKARIIATNCQLTNCGGNVVSIENGGEYDFRNCTLARYFYGRGYPCLAISNFAYDTLGEKLPGELTGAYFGNCIITGSQSGEVFFNELEGTLFNFSFDQCLVQWDTVYYKKYMPKFENCINNKQANFIDYSLNDFQLDTLSAAIDAASLLIINNTVPSIILDRKGISRLVPGPPDMGAYERVEKR